MSYVNEHETRDRTNISITTEIEAGSEAAGVRSYITIFLDYSCVSFLQAATRLVGGNTYQNLGTNTMYGACAAPATAGTGEVGCLGMSGGSSTDLAMIKGGAKGKGKGKGKAIHSLHPNGQMKFAKKPKKLLLCV